MEKSLSDGTTNAGEDLAKTIWACFRFDRSPFGGVEINGPRTPLVFVLCVCVQGLEARGIFCMQFRHE